MNPIRLESYADIFWPLIAALVGIAAMIGLAEFALMEWSLRLRSRARPQDPPKR